MITDNSEFGKPNPNAPDELCQFAFVISKWRGEGMSSMNPERKQTPYEMTWVGRYILDGNAIADDALIPGEDGRPEAIFMAYRSYDSGRNKCNIEALNVLGATLQIQVSTDRGKLLVKNNLIILAKWTSSVESRDDYDRFGRSLHVSTGCLVRRPSDVDGSSRPN